MRTDDGRTCTDRLDRLVNTVPAVTGKGGVGKTTIASTVAVALADAGRRVLLVSTDPASNLSDVFGMKSGEHPTAVPGAPGLEIMNLDPHEAAKDYRVRVIGPDRGVLPDTEVAANVNYTGAGLDEEPSIRVVGDRDAEFGVDLRLLSGIRSLERSAISRRESTSALRSSLVS